MTTPSHFAALDLGSNSFHLVIMKNEENGFASVDCRRELVRLASGVHKGRVSPDAKVRALRCLTHFKQYLGEHSSIQVTAVGTSAFRSLQQDRSFLRAAENALGHPIRILTGEDEARYIYIGASQGRPNEGRIVLDIGGGSTEIIYGHGSQPIVPASLEIGSVTLTTQFLDYDSIPEKQLQDCIAYVDDQLASITDQFKAYQWTDALGASGTIKAVSWAMHNLGISEEGVIHRDQLDRLLPVLTQAESQHQLSQLLELNPRRIAVFAAGYIIMQRIFHVFDIKSMRISNKAIREGILEEMRQALSKNTQA